MKPYKIFLSVFVALLPVMLLRDYTPDNELRYLSIADEALRNGTLATFTNHGMAYADKPPLYFWFIMLGKWLLGQHCMWFISLFSIIPAFVITGVMNRWVSHETDEATRTTGTWLMLSCGLFTGMMVVLRMDMLMCMFITLSLYTFYQMLHEQPVSTRHTVLFPVYVFLAVFSKGPVGILIPLVSTIAFLLITGRICSIGRYWGWKTWLILVAGCALWFGAVYAEGGAAYLDNLLFHQTVDRAVNSFHHEEPFYYYFISIWYSLLPWSLLLIGLIVAAACQRRMTTELQKFFLTVVVSTFLMLSLVSSKIAVYMLPAFPFVAYLALTLLPRYKWNHWLALSVAVPVAPFCLALPALVVMGQMEKTAHMATPLFYAAALGLTVAGLASLHVLYRQKNTGLAIRLLAGGLFASVFIAGWGLPGVNGELGYGKLCDASMELARQHGVEEYCVWKIRRPDNMDVYLKKEVHVLESAEEAASAAPQGCVLMLPKKRLGELPESLSALERHEEGRYVMLVVKPAAQGAHREAETRQSETTETNPKE